MFPPPIAYTCYHDSQTSSSSLRINNSSMAHQMRSNMVSPFSMPCTAQISDFVAVSNVFNTSNPTIWNSTSNQLQNVFDERYQTFTPKPIDYFCFQQNSTSPNCQVPKDGSLVKKIHKMIGSYPEFDDYVNYEEGEGTEDNETVEWIHNLPYENDGSFICLKCNCLFDTSQILHAHLQFHCRSDTNEVSKKRLRVHHQEVHGKSHKINKDQTGGQSFRRK
ncbi:PREDICTED: uncharacterized protein LOC104720111 [Camelina sativa]|uniref:Uncharacterized protein LOC104720111 n=1 Tax=Camelina sativa TaxID=90675 RepID=A0ABM0U606_CAMSA|nr:PREDICTED: uncharacterized protein LOC104720111 [Camelina sativa]